jgi:hypothetical protein
MKTKTIALLSAAGLVLAACSGAPEEQPATETNVSAIGEPANMTNVMTEAPPATRIDNAATETAPPVAELVPDAQTQEDADAAGMTAKVNRDEPADEAQPAQ